MPRKREAARVVMWRGDWYLFYRDYQEDRPRRRLLTEEERRNRATRKECEDQAQAEENSDAEEARRRGGRLAYNTLLTDGLNQYRVHIKERVEARQNNPDARAGLAASSAADIACTLDLFETWLKRTRQKTLTTGQLDRRTLDKFFVALAAQRSYHGKREIRRSASTLNKHRRNMRSLISFLNGLQPPLFPDVGVFGKALTPLRASPKPPVAFTCHELGAYLRAALDYESEARTVRVHRVKPDGREEMFEQAVSRGLSTPVSRLFVILALTGCRLKEALLLTWQDTDLAKGHLTFRAQKTGRTRQLPLVGAPEGDVSPTLLRLLNAWRREDGTREFVLPHGQLSHPVFQQGAWQRINTLAKIRRVGPQLLRENFCSYAASLGMTTSSVAGWQGHSPSVADRFYRAQILERQKGATMESALGLSSLLEGMIGDCKRDVGCVNQPQLQRTLF